MGGERGGDLFVARARTREQPQSYKKNDGSISGATLQPRAFLTLTLSPAPSHNASRYSGMIPCVASLKTWILIVKGHFLVRLVKFPIAFLTLYLEINGSLKLPATAPPAVHRLLQRLRLSSFICTLTQGHDMNSIFYVGGADVMDRAPRPSGTLQRKGAGAAGASKSTSTASNSRTLPQQSETMPSHARSHTIDVVGRSKRLSLQFPISPAAGSHSVSQSPRSRPQSWVAGPPPVPSPEAPADASEPNILAVLAAQERYVLELKEELTKAEADLKTLKRYYSQHEASKRRNDVRKVAPLQPLNTALANVSPDSPEDGANILQQEMERRKNLLSNTKSSQRKVFSGSRHLRQLSLLSPDKNYSPSFPQPLNLLDDESVGQQQPTQSVARSSTSSDTSRTLLDIGETDKEEGASMPNIQREAIIRAGTQMANDFKTGLFTFIEDLRQATVGDEAVNGADGNPTSAGVKSPLVKSTRKASESRPALSRSASSKKSVARPTSFGDDFWKENGLSEPKTTAVTKKTHTAKSLHTHTQTPQKQTRPPVTEEEDWDNWDTPNDAYTDARDSSEESAPNSPPPSSRTSTRYHSKRHDSKASSLTNDSSVGQLIDISSEPTTRESKRNSIPWPDLVKMSPSNLKRTASHLMKEWEKQLTPPPESRNSSHSHGDYIGRSDAPTDLL